MRKFLNDDEHRLEEFSSMLADQECMSPEDKVVLRAMDYVSLANDFIKVRSLRTAADTLVKAKDAIEEAKKLWNAGKLSLDQEFMVVEAEVVFEEIYFFKYESTR